MNDRLTLRLPATGWTTAPLDEENLLQYREIMARVFGEPPSPALWRWKYGAGAGRSFGAWQGGRLIAHCGIVRSPVLVRGARVVAGQVVDLAVLPGARGVLRRDSPFQSVLNASVSAAADDVDSGGLVVGFPSNRASRLAEIHGLGELAEPLAEWVWTAPPQHAARRLERRRADARLVADARPAWSRMQRDLGEWNVFTRDGDRLVRRYVRHPAHQYDVWVLRSRLFARPTGLAVTRSAQGTHLLMDIIAPLAEAAGVVDAVRASLLGKGQGASLRAWVGRAQQPFLPAPDATRPLPLSFDVKCAVSPERAQAARGPWWLAMGDTDYL